MKIFSRASLMALIAIFTIVTVPAAAFASVDPFPTYSGNSQCPAGTYMNATPVVTRTVDSTSATGINFPLSPNASGYVFQASGTFIPTSATGFLADAGYTTINNVLSTQYGINGIAPDKGSHALLADLGSGVGILDWGSYNAGHMYSKHFVLATSSVQFVIGDRFGNWYDTEFQNQTGQFDNSGSLTLNVFACVPNVPVNDSANGNQCKKDGWKTMYTNTGKAFKNQGDCVSYFKSSANAVANKIK